MHWDAVVDGHVWCISCVGCFSVRQLFKGTFYFCDGPDVRTIKNKTDCINKGPPYRWVNRKYNFDNLGQVRQDSGHCKRRLVMKEKVYGRGK